MFIVQYSSHCESLMGLHSASNWQSLYEWWMNKYVVSGNTRRANGWCSCKIFMQALYDADIINIVDLYIDTTSDNKLWFFYPWLFVNLIFVWLFFFFYFVVVVDMITEVVSLKSILSFVQSHRFSCLLHVHTWDYGICFCCVSLVCSFNLPFV